MPETWSGEFYCVRCQDKRHAEAEVATESGTRLAKAVCAVCGAHLNLILGEA